MSLCRSLAIAGKPGRYISIEKGANAVKAPNMMMRKKYLLLVILPGYWLYFTKVHNVYLRGMYQTPVLVVLIPDRFP